MYVPGGTLSHGMCLHSYMRIEGGIHTWFDLNTKLFCIELV